MLMVWIGLILFVYVVVAAFVYSKIRKNRYLVLESQENNLKIAKEELEKKEKILRDLLETSLGLIRKEDILSLDAMLDDLQASITAEKGRFTITETEVDSIEIRLRELGELRRELEVSNMDALREVEMLRTQERDIANQNEALSEQLAAASDQVDILIDMFPADDQFRAQITTCKDEIGQIQDKLTFYQKEVANINQQYVVLKKAYDALDIEYAQLYEKRQQSKGSDSEDSEDE
jgi:chromosome segregation ATPase